MNKFDAIAYLRKKQQQEKEANELLFGLPVASRSEINETAKDQEAFTELVRDRQSERHALNSDER